MKDPFELNAKSIMALYELFPTEEACIKHLEAINWHGKPVSPFDKTSKVYKLKSGKYRCKNTGKNFTWRAAAYHATEGYSSRGDHWYVAGYHFFYPNGREVLDATTMAVDCGLDGGWWDH